MEDNSAQGAPARGLVRVAMYEDNNAQGAPARGLVRVVMNEDNVNAQGAPARGLVRVRTCIEDCVSVQKAPARGLVTVGTGNHHQISRRMKKWHTNRNPDVHGCEYPGPAQDLMEANAVAGLHGA
ncbi:hypothetical protein PoB_006693600 [Plakobranchus ocellatus]|uniref:Uncharacterized protein n=1 Tax=Plakobranchus ocellatus TaxID=259542 RepID=A0AAV4D8Q5_9GAST|nr:hypothetical protein PoB_006693600 [Plakobranchus ocellatus]